MQRYNNRMAHTDYAALDDETLIGLIAGARTESLAALYDRYGRLVFSVAVHVVGDGASAEEITQDVFVRVWQHAGQYRADRGKVSTWLTGIARNRAIDRLRRRGARPDRHAVAWSDLAPESAPAHDGPQEEVAVSLERERVRAAVTGLPEEQQRVLALAYFGGRTQREIADELGLPLGTVKTRVRLGMDRLRRALAGGVGTG